MTSQIPHGTNTFLISNISLCILNWGDEKVLITKCDDLLLQSVTASFITKCDNLLLQSATAIFVLHSATSVITKCGKYYKVKQFYYKVRQVLQSAMIITKCDRTGSSTDQRQPRTQSSESSDNDNNGDKSGLDFQETPIYVRFRYAEITVDCCGSH